VRTSIEKGDKLVAVNQSKGTKFELAYELSERERDIILAGGTLAYMKPE
jgi:aconitate hydratase